MRILITGGAGFIGSHLAEALVREGHRVFILDDLSTGNLKNLKGLLQRKSVVFKKGSVLAKRDIASLARNADQIYHLAAAVGVKTVVEKPLDSMMRNIDGTKHVLEVAELKGTPVLITSSSEVYGKNPCVPFREDADRVYGSAYHERWGYALSKAADEFLGLSYWRERKLPTVIVRLFNTTGPRQSGKYGMVVPRLIAQALRGEDMTVYGDGRQVRCFTYVADVVSGLIALMNEPRARGEIFNLGTREHVSINALARRIKRFTNSTSRIVHIPYAKAYNKTFEDMRTRIPDISKAEKLVGYAPRYALDDILRAMIAYIHG